MQALSIWPSASESWPNCATPQLDFESYSSYNWVTRQKNIFRGLLYLSRDFRSRSANPELKWRFLYVYPKSKVYLSLKPKGGFRGTSLSSAWAVEEQEIGDNVTKVDFENSSDFSEEDSIQSTCEKLEVGSSTCSVVNGGDKKNDDPSENNDGYDGGIDLYAELDDENNARIDVRALAWTLQSAKDADDVGKILKDKGELPLQVYSSIIRGFGKDKKLTSAMVLYNWLKRKGKETDGSLRPNLFIYNSLLGAMKQSGNLNDFEKVINDMNANGVHPNVVTYNSLMGIYIEQGRESEALQLFKEMPQKGVSPSPATYSVVFDAYRRLEDGFGALSFFTEIIQKFKKGEIGKDSDEDWKSEFDKLENFTVRICYQVMRRWLVASENLSTDVLRLLTEMDKAGLRPGRAEHERLMWACTREEHCAVIKELYTRIREMNSEISLSVCNHVIWLMGKARKWWTALEIYEDLLDKGPNPNNMSYELMVSHFNVLLSAARKKGIWRWGVRLLNKMEEKGLKPGSREWNSVLVACSKAAETSVAIEIFKRMVEQGEKPTIVSYGALLSALEKGKLYDEALRVWKHMTKVGIKPNLYAYTIMASIYAGQGKLNIVDSIIREMVTVGVDPTVVTFNAIISGCARSNLRSAGYEWFKRMEVQKITPNEITYEILIEALANDGKPRLAYEMHLRAQKEGLVLSTKAYDSVIRSARMYGATIDISNLGARPPEKKKRVQIRKDLSEFCNFADVPRRSKPFNRKEVYVTQTEE
ncbi:pentatricopeptide repeat-containing protein-like [Dorcoceras hygrometricum]|uniref:Pentatricopeptide repeat-containing protein-like n=1 Tax=Dorcoceras hygrometricum TaxID=472368 RepID=A0A2Z7A0N8_9LAMI|nr:pentatricopeptide repeat-containing protein-like [Dorcoceras hygrometricum]